jgi:hypothetical protein
MKNLMFVLMLLISNHAKAQHVGGNQIKNPVQYSKSNNLVQTQKPANR